MKEHRMNPVCLSRRDGFGLRQISQWPLSLERSLILRLGEGDIVRADGGIVWATVDGELEDIMLNVGDTYLVPRAQRMRFGGYDDARMSVISGAQPLPAQSAPSRQGARACHRLLALGRHGAARVRRVTRGRRGLGPRWAGLRAVRHASCGTAAASCRSGARRRATAAPDSGSRSGPRSA